MIDVTALLRSAGFVGEGLELHQTTTPAGTTLSDLVNRPEVLDDAVTAYYRNHESDFGPSARRDISALWMLQDVAWLHAVFAVGLLPRHRISMLAGQDTLRLTLPRDFSFAVEVDPQELTTSVATNAVELAAAYRVARSHLIELFAPLQPVFAPHLKAGARAFWACVTDMMTGAICTGASGQRESALSQALDLATSDATPLLAGVTLINGPMGLARRRHGCCLLYAIDGMSVCTTCPRI